MTKEKLKAYRDMKKEKDDLEQRIEALNAQLYGLRAQRLDGMPRGGSGENYGTEILIQTKDNLLALLRGKKLTLDAQLVKIEHAIEKLEPRERHLIRLHYIDGLTWEQVAVEMDYSWRQVHRIHGDALAKLKEEEERNHATD